MNDTTLRTQEKSGQRGFTLVEALVAIVVLIFGLMAVTNLMLVAASSNTVANQGTAAVTSASRAMDMLKATTFSGLGAGGSTWDVNDGGKACDDTTLAVSEWHCSEDISGVGRVHTHWWIINTGDLRLKHIRIRSEGTGVLTGARSRSEFTTFRACTNSDPATGGCPQP